MTRETIESALDSGKLFIKIYTNRGNGPSKYWAMRRNGKTKLWKTRPNDFRIPCKFGFRGHDAIDQHALTEFNQFYRIADSREDAERGQ